MNQLSTDVKTRELNHCLRPSSLSVCLYGSKVFLFDNIISADSGCPKLPLLDKLPDANRGNA